MVSANCRAKDPKTCPYHGAVLRMYDAQESGDFETYFIERTKVEELEKINWDDNAASWAGVQDDSPAALVSANMAALSSALDTDKVTALPIIPKDERFARQTLLGGQRIYAHTKGTCAGHNCSIHNPSNHPLDKAPLNWRSDIGVMERICSHGVGHPDPDDVAFRVSKGAAAKTAGSHGCDGCCVTVPAQAAAPVAATTPKLKNLQGEDAETIIISDKNSILGDTPVVFTKREPGIYPAQPKFVRLKFDRNITDDEAQKIQNLMAYQSSISINHEPLTDPYRDTKSSLIVGIDTTNTFRSALGDGLDDFEQALPELFRKGTPRRKTNRKGPIGSRLINGFNEDLKFEIFYDDVTDGN